MSPSGKGVKIASWVLHGLLGAAMLLAGGMKAFGLAPEEMAADMAKNGLGDKITLIGAGELACAVLLLVPRTMPLGVWLTSGFWGGAICLHMSKGESYAFQSALLLMTWAGAVLRDPRVLAGLWGPGSRSAPADPAVAGAP